jgi:uncharacterized protein (DUF302 family)
MTVNSENGLVNVPSNHSVEQTVQNVERILQTKGIKLFTLIDHSGEAETAGMEMRPTKLLVFGNPKAGTPLMLAAPSIAIDLPLKFLIWEDADAHVWITYNSPAYLEARHGFPSAMSPNIAVVEALARASVA